MRTNVVYEISQYASAEADAALLEQARLFFVDDVLRMSDAAGRETICGGTDIIEVVRSTPSLSTIRAGIEFKISCSSAIYAQLPLVLTAACDDNDFSECYAAVNGVYWSAYQELGAGFVMLPRDNTDCGPDMSPCWAEYAVMEGECNPLTASTSIGLATPAVVVEYGDYSAGGVYGESGVVIAPLGEFVPDFVDWLLKWPALREVWGGDSWPRLPAIELFAGAAANSARRSSWHSEADEDPANEGEDYEDVSDYAAASLELYLSDEQIDQVRARLISVDPEYAALLEQR